jgi:HSP20 family protein
LPGFLKDDISINIDNNVLAVTAFKRECHKGEEGIHYFRRERAWGKCTRHLRLPSNLNPETAETTFLNGVLIIKLPKIATSATHKHLIIA